MPVNRVLMKTALLSGGLGGARRLLGSGGPQGQSHPRSVAGLRLSGIVVAMLAHAQSARRVAAAIFVAGIFVGADAMSRAAGVPSYIADVMVATALLSMVTAILFTRYRVQVEVSMEALEILFTASFWAAAIRIASPLIFATMGELICERAGVLNLGIEGIMTAGAFAGWFTVYAGGDLWLGVLVAAWPARCSACCMRCSPCRSACRSMSSASASRCSPPASPISPTAWPCRR